MPKPERRKAPRPSKVSAEVRLLAAILEELKATRKAIADLAKTLNTKRETNR